MKSMLKRQLVEAITSANDFEGLKQSLLAILGVAAVDEESESDELIAHTPGKEVGVWAFKRRKLTDDVKASKHASSSRSKNNAASVDKSKQRVNNVTKINMANSFPVTGSVDENGTSVNMEETAETGETSSNIDNNGTNVDITDDTFHTVQNPRNAAKAARKANTAAARPARPTPLVLEGVREEDRSNPLKVRKLLEGSSDSILRTATTKGGVVLVFAKSEAERDNLLKATLPSGLSIRPTKASQAAAKAVPFAVIMGVRPTINQTEIQECVGLPCKRLLSSKQGGAETWKVKVQCTSIEQRAVLIKTGVFIGLQRYNVTEFRSKQSVLQCYNCQAFNHVASACKGTLACKKCGESHTLKDCKADALKCANCSGNHSAADFACPEYAKETVKRDVSSLSYANAVRKSGDKIDCVRLACTVAVSMVTIASKRLNQQVNASDVCKDVAESVSRFYKVDINGAHVHDIAYSKAVKA